MNLTLEKHFMKLSFTIKNKLNIKKIQQIFFYAFNTIIKLFFTTNYIWIITLTLIFHDHPLVEYPLLCFCVRRGFLTIDILISIKAVPKSDWWFNLFVKNLVKSDFKIKKYTFCFQLVSEVFKLKQYISYLKSKY